MWAVKSIASADRAWLSFSQLVIRLSIVPPHCAPNISILTVKTTNIDLIVLIKMLFMVKVYN
jgi:hypothetical protein